MKRNNIRIAIQKSGRLRAKSEELLKQWGVQYKIEDSDVLVVPAGGGEFEILFVRYSDIPEYVQDGAADFGIVGQNILHEDRFDVETVRPLDFGKCNLIIGAPKASSIKTVADLEGERIATSYPNSLKKFLKKEKLGATVIKIRGGVEAAPAIGLADAICDITQSGRTLKANGLQVIATLLESQAVLIASKFMGPKALAFRQKIQENL